MFSGKTTKANLEYRKRKIASRKVICIKPVVDKRYKKDSIVSHDKFESPAYAVSNLEEIKSKIKEENPECIIFDEVQLFEKTFKKEEIDGFIKYLLDLRREGKEILIYTLNKDYRGMPFLINSLVIPWADKVETFSAICKECGNKAYYTQRTRKDGPASFYEETIIVNGSDLYEAKCRKHHKVRDKPSEEEVYNLFKEKLKKLLG